LFPKFLKIFSKIFEKLFEILDKLFEIFVRGLTKVTLTRAKSQYTLSLLEKDNSIPCEMTTLNNFKIVHD
jgi:hypothetical protein